MATTKRRTITTRVDDHTVKRLKHLGVDLERSVESLMLEAIEDFLEKHRPKPKPKKEKRPYLELARDK